MSRKRIYNTEAERKEARKEYQKRWYAMNKERVSEYNKKQHLKNREKNNKRSLKNYKKNKPIYRKREKEYRERLKVVYKAQKTQSLAPATLHAFEERMADFEGILNDALKDIKGIMDHLIWKKPLFTGGKYHEIPG